MASRYWLPVTVAAVILVVSLLPGGGGSGLGTVGPVGVDKLLHGVGYAVLAATALFARQPRSRVAILGIVVAVTAFGGAIELLQAPVPGRHVSILDLVADAVGALAGGAAWWVGGDDSTRGEAA